MVLINACVFQECCGLSGAAVLVVEILNAPFWDRTS